MSQHRLNFKNMGNRPDFGLRVIFFFNTSTHELPAAILRFNGRSVRIARSIGSLSFATWLQTTTIFPMFIEDVSLKISTLLRIVLAKSDFCI